MSRLAARPVDDARGRAGYSEFGVVGLLAGIGVLVLIETRQIRESLVGSHTLGPRVAPYVVGTLLLVIAAFLAIDIARGGHGEAELGEDVDLSHGTDWVTLVALAAVVGATGYLIPVLGFPAAGSLMLFGCTRLLGSRRVLLDVMVSVGLAVASYVLFTELLGIYLPLVGGE